MQRVMVERKASARDRARRFAVLPLDPRDPDILRAKLLERQAAGRIATTPVLPRSR